MAMMALAMMASAFLLDWAMAMMALVRALTRLVLLLCLINEALFLQSHGVHVAVMNRVGNGTGMTLHCKSKDTDLGQQNVTDGGEFGWDFSPNILGTTLFYCDLAWGSLQGYPFVAYDFHRDCVRCAAECGWLVATEGMYGLNVQSGFWEFFYQWPDSVSNMKISE